MALIGREEAIDALSKHLPAFYQVVMGAWNDYMSYPIEKRIVHSPRSRASLIHDHMIDRATKYAIRETDVHIIERSKLYLFVFGDNIAIRFKKFDEKLEPRNQPSNQVYKFRHQEQLPGVRAAHNLEAGYILADDEQSVRAIHLVCPTGNKPHWEILLTEETQTTMVEDLFSNKVPEKDETGGAKVVPRRKATIIRLDDDDRKS